MGWEVAAANVRALRRSGDIPHEFNYQVSIAIFLLLTVPVRVQAQIPGCHCGGGSGYASTHVGTVTPCGAVVLTYLLLLTYTYDRPTRHHTST